MLNQTINDLLQGYAMQGVIGLMLTHKTGFTLLLVFTRKKY